MSNAVTSGLATVVIADDHPLFRAALTQAVSQVMGCAQVLEANSVAELLRLIAENPQLELVFLDLHMPDNQGFTSLCRLQNHHPDLLVLMVSSDDNPQIMQSASARGRDLVTGRHNQCP